MEDGVDRTNLTWTVQTGLTNGTNHIVVSETDGSPGSDPYGHTHGRIYSVDKPGFYRVGFRFVDTSTNGPGGGPIQAPSERFYLNLQADLTIAGIANTPSGIEITFAAASDIPDEDPTAPPTNYQVESTPVLGPDANWQPVGDLVVGDDHMHTIAVPMAGASAFFRLKAIR
jgi:hypothetical protein